MLGDIVAPAREKYSKKKENVFLLIRTHTEARALLALFQASSTIKSFNYLTTSKA